MEANTVLKPFRMVPWELAAWRCWWSFAVDVFYTSGSKRGARLSEEILLWPTARQQDFLASGEGVAGGPDRAVKGMEARLTGL